LGAHEHVTTLLALLVGARRRAADFDALYLVLECCDSDLFKVLNSTATLDGAQVRAPFSQLAPRVQPSPRVFHLFERIVLSPFSVLIATASFKIYFCSSVSSCF
jgi:hypothetical protein